jgi:RNA polymerase sigma-70 factor (ECF subfamily)
METTTKAKAQQKFNLSADQLQRFNKIHAKHFNEILNYIKFKVNCVEDAEEICIDTFEKACRYMDSFDESKSKLGTWLHNIANTCISDHYKKDGNAYRYNEISTSDFADEESGLDRFQFVEVESADSLAENNELHNKIVRAFRSLKPKYRKIATLYFLREKEYAEIAEICDVPMGTVKGMISRCRAMLQMELA